MLQDIAPHIYHNEMAFENPKPEAVALVYGRDGVLAKTREGQLILAPPAGSTPFPWTIRPTIYPLRHWRLRALP